MVTLPQVQTTLSSLPTTLPPNLVAVFCGATAGIGETSLKEFARHAPSPRIYFIGRSQEAGDRLEKELKEMNASGEYTFMKSDTSLLKNVDEVCREIKKRERVVNVLFLSQGTLKFNVDTSEGLHYLMALTYYSRTRFIVNLLPLLRAAPSLRRIVTVMAGGKEGPVFDNDWQARKIPFRAGRGHLCTMLTLSLQAMAEKAPEVSFIHNYPGAIKTNLIRGDEGFVMFIAKYFFKFVMLFTNNLPFREAGERHAFLCVSAKYPAARDATSGSGVALVDGIEVARGIDGKDGSGVYSVDWDGESVEPKAEKVIADYRTKGMMEKLWTHTEETFRRITGSDTI